MTTCETRCVVGDQLQRQQYQQLTQGWGFVDFSIRTQIELRGRDRQRFLHNLCTNDIQRLSAGQGCEAFVTSVQGKCVGHILMFAGGDALIVETSPDQAATLLPHWDRYLITEDVQLIDRSQDWGELLLAGPQCESRLQSLVKSFALPNDYAHQLASLDEIDVWLRRVPMTCVPTYLIAVPRDVLPEIQARLQSAGAAPCSLAAFQMARIERGFPWYGWDITEQNLPQEVHRDEVAISFHKGCYLGQETVARIDALGHVNRLLVGVRCDSAAVPAEGTPLTVDGQTVGQVTSAAYSPRLQAPMALAYVRRSHSQPGTSLQLPSGLAEVIALPLSEG